MNEVFSSYLDLSDQLHDDPNMEYFINKSSFVHQDKRLAGYVVVILHAFETKKLPKETSAQKAEFIALTHALQLEAGFQANIYIDSKYAFTTLPVHGALCKEEGLINSGGKDIKYGQKNLELLKAVWTRKRVTVIHCQGHQKGNLITAWGNQKADQVAQQIEANSELASPAPVLEAGLLPTPLKNWNLKYSLHEQNWLDIEEGRLLKEGWHQLKDGWIVVPETLTFMLVLSYHQDTHIG
jgi:ribonuclease HI